VWISTGHLTGLKDPISVIKKFKTAFENNNNHFLLFLGNGDLKAECLNLTRDMDNVLFTGRVSNVGDYLQASDYFVSASKSEGLPMAVVEAMACGLPVLLSDIDPHLELFNLNNKIGTFFKLGSDQELQNKFTLL